MRSASSRCEPIAEIARLIAVVSTTRTIASLSFTCNSTTHRASTTRVIALLMMPKTKRPARPTNESRAFKAALDASEISKARFADMVGVTPGLVSQWASGRTPIAAVKAPMVADTLNLGNPSEISAAYRDVELAKTNVLPMTKPTASEETREMGLVIARLENDVHVLNLAVGLLVGVMRHHRQAEADNLAATIRRRVPPRYRNKGLFGELLAALEAPARGS